MPIHLLTDKVASQIAAGEVVERPASVVKELLENALDAGATQIRIRLDQAGKRLIEVTDNGAGISFNELSLAVARHATSKILSAEDLFSICTLGFRGEALASIGSVSNLTLTSKTADAHTGGRLRVEGGKNGSVETVGAPQGTVVTVGDLFFNVPARLKFLKADATERRHAADLVTRYALAYPQVRFHLLLDGVTALQTSGNGNPREVLSALYGVERARQMLEIELLDEGDRIRGYISPVAQTRSNRREISFFVNGRWVQDAALTSSLIHAYQNMIMVGRYPTAVLFLEVPPEEVDVNVHPAKAEVRFRNHEKIFANVHRAVRRGLMAFSPVPELRPIQWNLVDQATQKPEMGVDPAWQIVHDPELVSSPTETVVGVMPGNVETAAPAIFPSGSLPLLRLVGQIGAAYLVAEGPDGLYLIDQHAAHERVLFEQMMRLRQTTIPAQTVLEPAVVQLAPGNAQLLEEKIPLLKSLGFEIEPFGPNTFRVHSVPALLAEISPEAALRAVVEDFEEDETPLQNEIEAKIVARICKRSAVKAGKVLSVQEQEALLRGLEGCRSPRTCPHGRPTMIHLSVDLLERQFGRRGSR